MACFLQGHPPAQFVAGASGPDAHDANDPPLAGDSGHDPVGFQVESDGMIFDCELKVGFRSGST